jgi:hypothetical protein
VVRTHSESCPVEGFSVGGVEPSNSAAVKHLKGSRGHKFFMELLVI